MKAAQKRYTNKTVPGIYASALQKTSTIFRTSIEKKEKNTANIARITSCISEKRMIPSYVLKIKKKREDERTTVIKPSASALLSMKIIFKLVS